MEKEARMVMKIFVICSVFVGALMVEMVSWKVFKTAVNLAALNDNARLYNEQSVKTDKMSKEYRANQKERQKFYNSDDDIVRFYSNSNMLVKIALWLVATVFLTAVSLSASYLTFVWIIEKYKAKVKREQLKAQAKREKLKRKAIDCLNAKK